ncbi:MAG TPA: glycosyltransferase [Burkholderiales bacterium]|nr:glycosyltransferase [Burkholderiales bacterium]
MRVALYVKRFPLPGAPLTGGTSLAVDGLASGLSENGADVSVLCEGPRRTSVRTATGYSVECFPNHQGDPSFKVSPELAPYAARQLASRDAVCLVNGMFQPSAYAMSRLLNRAGIPYIAVPHDPYDRALFHRNASVKWPYWYLFERRLLVQARAIQVLDMKHIAGLRRLGVDTPVIETPNGIGPGEVPAEPQLQWRQQSAPARLVYLGRLDAYSRGLDLLLDAFARIAPLTKVRLTLQGPDWGDRARLERRAAAWAITEKVEFRVPDYERTAPELIGDHDVLCLPSRFEGFGLAALEAMLAGRVVLVSEHAGVARHVLASGCGIAVRPTMPGVEEGLLALLRRRDEWREMGMRGRRYALANLQWRDIAAAALKQYKRLLA